MKFERVVRDGKVAVLVSPGFGAGWSSWAGGTVERKATLCMDARLVQLVLEDKREECAKLAEEMFPNFYTGGADQLEVEWLPEGTVFLISEHAGRESIQTLGDTEYMVA